MALGGEISVQILPQPLKNAGEESKTPFMSDWRPIWTQIRLRIGLSRQDFGLNLPLAALAADLAANAAAEPLRNAGEQSKPPFLSNGVS